MSKHVGIIPLRRGSKGIPGKNKIKVLGRALYLWVLHEAYKSNLDKVYVYTDDEEIIQFVEKEFSLVNKIEALQRNSANATDTSSTEAALIDFSNHINYKFETLTLLQATSPLTVFKDINNSLEQVIERGYDSCLSLVREKRFIWNENGESINYDFNNRPRRQDFQGLLIENGAVYTTSHSQFIETRNRLGGKIGYIEMAGDTYVEIDERSDLVLVEDLLKNRLKKLKGIPTRIKLFVMDVDGVLTDGHVMYSKNGEFGKVFNMRDGMGMEVLIENQIIPVILTSENSELVIERARKLKINECHVGVKDKFAYLENLISKFNVSRNELAYIGDDINDYANIVSCGWGFCPNDAVNTIKQNADVILNNCGGKMAIREAVDFIVNYNKRF